MVLDNQEIILEALNDYRRWFGSEDHDDKEKREEIDKAMGEIKRMGGLKNG